jgi:hypothetical protein
MTIIKAAAVQISPVLYRGGQGLPEDHRAWSRGRAVRRLPGDGGAVLPVSPSSRRLTR